MSDNLKTVRHAFDLLASGDFGSLVGLLDADVQWSGADPEPEDYDSGCHSRDEVIDFLGDWRTHGLTPILQELLDSGQNVLAVVLIPGSAELLGLERDEPGYHVLTLRDDIIVRITNYPDRALALSALVSTSC